MNPVRLCIKCQTEWVPVATIYCPICNTYLSFIRNQAKLTRITKEKTSKLNEFLRDLPKGLVTANRYPVNLN